MIHSGTTVKQYDLEQLLLKLLFCCSSGCHGIKWWDEICGLSRCY